MDLHSFKSWFRKLMDDTLYGKTSICEHGVDVGKSYNFVHFVNCRATEQECGSLQEYGSLQECSSCGKMKKKFAKCNNTGHTTSTGTKWLTQMCGESDEEYVKRWEENKK